MQKKKNRRAEKDEPEKYKRGGFLFGKGGRLGQGERAFVQENKLQPPPPKPPNPQKKVQITKKEKRPGSLPERGERSSNDPNHYHVKPANPGQALEEFSTGRKKRSPERRVLCLLPRNARTEPKMDKKGGDKLPSQRGRNGLR